MNTGSAGSIERTTGLSRPSRRGVLIASLVAALTLGACGHQQAPPPATEQPDPPSWLVGEVDRTTPAPSPAPMASLAVGDSAFQPPTLFLSGGEAMRIKNSGTALHSIILAGVEVASVEPGASKVVSVALEPGRYEFSLREDPSTPERLLSRSGTPPAGRRPTSKLTEQEAKWRIMTSDEAVREGSGERAVKEPRWPASLAVIAALLLYMTLPGKLTVGPGWVIPALEAALLIPLTVRAPYRHHEEVRLVRLASLLLIALVNLASVASLVLLVRLVLSGGAVSGRELVFSGIQIWLTLILVFALWFWEIDRGGPGIRVHTDERDPDFLFPQMASHELGQTDWMPQFIDYVYLSFTNATAFSPTDTMPLTPRAKALMAVEALASITTIVMVAGRAVNILK